MRRGREATSLEQRLASTGLHAIARSRWQEKISGREGLGGAQVTNVAYLGRGFIVTSVLGFCAGFEGKRRAERAFFHASRGYGVRR